MRIFIAIAILAFSVPERAMALDLCQVPHGATKTINEHGVCRKVTNNHASGLALMVPTKSAAEWSTGGNAFITHAPPGVTVAACTGGAIAYRTYSTSTGTTITVPAGVAAGDILVFLDHATKVTSGHVTPAGFTRIDARSGSKNGNNYYTGFYYKLATGGESGTVLSGLSGTGSYRKLLLVLSAGAAGVTIGGKDSDCDYDGSPDAVAVASSAGTAPVIILHAAVAALLNNPYGVRYDEAPTPTPQGQVDLGSPASARITYGAYNTGPVPDAAMELNDMGTATCAYVAYLQVEGGASGSCQ